MDPPPLSVPPSPHRERELGQGEGLNGDKNKHDCASGEGEKVFDEDSVAAQGTPQCPLEENSFWIENIPYEALRQC